MTGKVKVQESRRNESSLRDRRLSKQRGKQEGEGEKEGVTLHVEEGGPWKRGPTIDANGILKNGSLAAGERGGFARKTM